MSAPEPLARDCPWCAIPLWMHSLEELAAEVVAAHEPALEAVGDSAP